MGWPSALAARAGVRLADAARATCAYCVDAASSASIRLHDSAVRRLKEVLKDTPDQFLRVRVDSGGCSGFQYVFSLDDERLADDLMVQTDGVELAVDKVSLEFLRGATLEYAEDMVSSSFRVKDNPNSAQSCGCGSSFAAKM